MVDGCITRALGNGVLNCITVYSSSSCPFFKLDCTNQFRLMLVVVEGSNSTNMMLLQDCLLPQLSTMIDEILSRDAKETPKKPKNKAKAKSTA